MLARQDGFDLIEYLKRQAPFDISKALYHQSIFLMHEAGDLPLMAGRL